MKDFDINLPWKNAVKNNEVIFCKLFVKKIKNFVWHCSPKCMLGVISVQNVFRQRLKKTIKTVLMELPKCSEIQIMTCKVLTVMEWDDVFNLISVSR